MRLTLIFVTILGLFTASHSHANTKKTVGCVQAQLEAAGFDPGPVDGLLGARTRAALDEFESANETVTTRKFDAVLGAAICRRIGLIAPDLKQYWPAQSGPVEIIYAASVEDGFRAAFEASLGKSVAALEPLLEIELAGRDTIIVANNAADIVSLVRSASDVDLSDLRQKANEACSSSRGISAQTYPGIAFFCKSSGSNAPDAIDQSWLDFVIAHEFFHLLQFQLSGTLLANRPDREHLDAEGPMWLIEGSAQAFANRIAIQTPDWDYRIVNYGRLDNNFPALQGLESRRSLATNRANVYRAGSVAAIDLIELAGYPNILNFYALLGFGHPWKTAFEDAFGISVADYYRYYEDVQRFNADGTPIRGPLRQ